MSYRRSVASATDEELYEVKAKIFLLAQSLRHIVLQLLPDIEKISSTSSPSSAFTKIQTVARVKISGISPSELVGLAKLSRWLAVVRRDYGDQAYTDTLAELKQLLGLQQQATSAAPQQVQQAPQPQLALIGASLSKAVIPGIYRFGHYDWLAESRLEKLESLVGDLGNLRQLAIELFHSLYLLNTELVEERVKGSPALQAISEFTKPLRENTELRKHTVLDENLSLTLTAEIVKHVIEQLKNHNVDPQSVQLGCGCTLSTGQQQGAQTVDDVVRYAVEEAVKELEERAGGGELEKLKTAFEVLDKFVGLAAGVGHHMEFSDKVPLAELLSKYTVFLSNFYEVLRSRRSEASEGSAAEFAGYQVGGDITKLRLTELAYPDDYFDYRLVTGKYMTKVYSETPRGRRGKRYVVLIDKSGSMDGQKIEWAKAVSLALLLKRRVDDVGVMFFDYDVYPSEPMWVRKDPVEALKRIATVSAGGGTSIMRAIEKASQYDADVVVITDGIDTVYPEDVRKLLGNRRLVVFYIEGWNEDLAKVAHKMYNVTPDANGAKLALKEL